MHALYLYIFIWFVYIWPTSTSLQRIPPFQCSRLGLFSQERLLRKQILALDIRIQRGRAPKSRAFSRFLLDICWVAQLIGLVKRWWSSNRAALWEGSSGAMFFFLGFFGFFGWKSWIRDGIAKNLEGTEERAASNSSFTSSTQIREVPQGARIAQVENGIFVDICGWLKSTIWWRSQKINLNMIWCPALFGNFFGYLQCIRQTFDRIRVKPWCMLQDSSMSELRSMSTGSSPSLRVSWSCTYHLDNLFLRSLKKHLEYLGTSTRLSTMFESSHVF